MTFDDWWNSEEQYALARSLESQYDCDKIAKAYAITAWNTALYYGGFMTEMIKRKYYIRTFSAGSYSVSAINIYKALTEFIETGHQAEDIREIVDAAEEGR